MSFLKRLFGGDTKFFDLLEAGAAEARNSARLLRELPAKLGTTSVDAAMADLAQSRRSHKRISQETTTQLCTNFVTPLEREDIEALSSSLYKIPKTVEKIAERLSICPPSVLHDVVAQQLTMLDSATEVIEFMVRELRRKAHVEKIQAQYEKLQAIEGDADKLMVGLLRDLYHGTLDAKEVLILKDLYELLEKAIDRCRDVGKTVFEVMLKYS